MGGGRLMRVVWKGAVSFGLVAIPVRLYVATDMIASFPRDGDREVTY